MRLLSRLLFVALCFGAFAPLLRAQNAAREFYSEYSRPNDDRFQNAAGGSGEPYEVSRIRITLVATPTNNGHQLSLRWVSKMVTGRHVEAGKHVVLRESRSSLKGETEILDPGRRKEEVIRDLEIVYPKGVDANSSIEDKIGSELKTSLVLGEVTEDGEYSGDLQMRTRASQKGDLITESSQGVTHFVGQKVSVFHNISWKVKIENGKAIDGEVKAARPTVPQLKLVDSNCLYCDSELKENQPYPKQPKAAKCKSETVGHKGEEIAEETEYDKLQKRMAKLIDAAGCTNCHGEGSAANFRFCDDGTPIYPKEDAHNIYALLTNAKEVKWDRYPSGMKEAVDDLREAEKESHSISAWAYKTGVAPGLDVVFAKGVVCTYTLRFSTLSGKAVYEAAMDAPPSEGDFNSALSKSCSDCLRQLRNKKIELLDKGISFASYGCVLTRESCQDAAAGTRFTIGSRSLRKALASVADENTDLISYCRTDE
ncbi:MAG: hypothetical protein H6617_07215 [Bdellovibrionaceae bacterium]|nr:hypothetical protein [Bdellovibrionales bacterium]MCB9254457.1 hypothetical protein [Pseudobdellovibrionaceae bacterium]